jgi:peptide/nickel transport system permease protein
MVGKSRWSLGRLPRRLLEYGITLFLAITLNFFLPRLMPGDPIALIAGISVVQLGEERINALREEYGLNKPLHEQYGIYLSNLVRGDLGESYRYSGGRSVTDILMERFGWTFLLVTSSLTIATIGGVLLGAWSAWRHGTLRDLGLLGLFFLLRSIPAFWLAMILIPVVAIQWQLLPVGDSYSFPRPSGIEGVVDVVRHAILPVTVLTLAYIPTVFAITRSAMLGEVGIDYIRTARAKGLSEKVILFRHALANAILPVVTVVALDIGQLLGGVLLIETVFNYRGLGGMMFEAVKSRDYPLLQGGFLLFTVGVLTINLLTDWLYTRLDPRIRESDL